MPEQSGNGTYLGIDYGRKGIGLAIGQRQSGTARPLETLRPEGLEQGLKRLIEEWQPEALVLGLPLPLDADQRDNPMIEEIRAFGAALEARFEIPVAWVDEALSTRASQTIFFEGPRKRREDFRRVKDQLAAALILETWFSVMEQRPLTHG